MIFGVPDFQSRSNRLLLLSYRVPWFFFVDFRNEKIMDIRKCSLDNPQPINCKILKIRWYISWISAQVLLCFHVGCCSVHTFDHDRYQLGSWNPSSCWQFRPHWRICIRIPTWFCFTPTSSIWVAGAPSTARTCTCENQIHAIPSGVILYCLGGTGSWVRIYRFL